MRFSILLPVFFALSACGSAPRVPAGWQTGAAATTTVSPRFDRAKKRVAVLPFAKSGQEGLNYQVPHKLAARLAEMGFEVIGPDRAEGALRELLVNPAKPISPEYIKRAGNLLGADYLLSGTIQYNRIPGSSTYMDERGAYGGGAAPREELDGQAVRLTDVETGEVVLSSFCCGDGFYGTSVAAEIAESIARALFPQRYKTSFRP